MNPAEIAKCPEERMKVWKMAIQMVKDGMNSGFVKDWGMATDLRRRYTLFEAPHKPDATACLAVDTHSKPYS